MNYCIICVTGEFGKSYVLEPPSRFGVFYTNKLEYAYTFSTKSVGTVIQKVLSAGFIDKIEIIEVQKPPVPRWVKGVTELRVRKPKAKALG